MKSSGHRKGTAHPRQWMRRFFGWWVKGPWWAKMAKLIGLAVVVYNIVTFCVMWCPPVRGVVLDIDTQEPIKGAIVQKYGEGPLLLPTEHSGGLWVDGAKDQAVTGANGRFTFRARAVRRKPSEAGWSEALFPLVWLDTVRVRVWQKDYIGVDSDRHGMWWSQDEPPASKGSCLVVRVRMPFFGYYYKILLKRALTKEQWTTKINSVSLGNIDAEEADEQERLFCDLTGYLERWPEGEMAGEYLGMAMFSALVQHEQATNAGKQDVRRFMKEDKLLLDLAKKVPKPAKPSGYMTNDYVSNLEQVKEEYTKLLKACPGEGRK